MRVSNSDLQVHLISLEISQSNSPIGYYILSTCPCIIETESVSIATIPLSHEILH